MVEARHAQYHLKPWGFKVSLLFIRVIARIPLVKFNGHFLSKFILAKFEGSGCNGKLTLLALHQPHEASV